ncbi:zinc finger domain protein [Penicillium herquei]|nr:zinc finger domain protein [Penicillium herquei]
MNGYHSLMLGAYIQFPRSGNWSVDVAPILEKCFLATLPPDGQLLAHITLREALHLIQLHDTVQRFARKYAAQAIEMLENEGIYHASTYSFTSSENYRIERSFYVFEVCCSLFWQSKNPLPWDDQLDKFFKRFAPWENEQLACIHDFLLDELEPAFNEVAAHDVKFGDLSIHWAENDNPWLQGYVSCGLKFLEKVSTACTYEERHRLLNEHLSPSSSGTPLIEILLESNGLYPEERDGLDDQAMVKLRLLPSQYNSLDPNSGPAEIWFQAHEGDDSSQYVAALAHRASRKVAYVMMDASRKRDMTRFDGTEKSLAWDTSAHENFVQQYAQQLRSFEIRSDIFLRGGRGWWSEGDTSQIQWHDASTL